MNEEILKLLITAASNATDGAVSVLITYFLASSFLPLLKTCVAFFGGVHLIRAVFTGILSIVSLANNRRES